jgi:hypothetical protein
MVSLAKLLRIGQGIEKKYKNIGLEKFRLSIGVEEFDTLHAISFYIIYL